MMASPRPPRAGTDGHPHLRAIRGGPPDRVDDSALVRRLQAGDRDALAGLFGRHFGPIRALVYRLIPGEGDLDDIVQEVFIGALKGIHNLREPEAFSGWLRTIAVNIVRRRLRRRKTQRALGLWSPRDVDEEILINPGAPPDVVAELGAVYRAIERLDVDSRTTLILHRVEEMPLTAVAETIGISLSTVKRLLKRADYELKIELERRDHEKS